MFGEGAEDAPLMIVGEQPSDCEDIEGHPFVGPAGKLLDRALREAGIARSKAYVTNAVKHFKWEPRGKRRLHKKPNSREMAACRPWLAAEVRILQPTVLLCLGGTAAAVILGPKTRVLRDRGQVMTSPFCEKTVVTVHPSSLLRAPDETSRQENYALFVRDLKKVARLL
jgi:DNA polymerase